MLLLHPRPGHARSARLAVAAALLLGTNHASALDLSPLTEVYREDYVGETGSPLTPEVDLIGAGSVLLFGDPGCSAPTFDGTNAQVFLPSGAPCGSGTLAVISDIPATGALGIRGSFAALSAATSNLATASVQALNPSSIRIETSVDVVEGGAAPDTATLRVCESDPGVGCTNPAQVSLSATAAVAILGGASFTLDLVVDRPSSSAFGSIDIQGVGTFATSVALVLLAGQTPVFALQGMVHAVGNPVTGDLVDLSIRHDGGCDAARVVPNGHSWIEGAANNSAPFALPSVFGSVRAQQVFSAAEFPCSGRRFITGIALRPDTITGAGSWTVPDVEIRLSTTSAAPDALSTTFADNAGADEKLVFSGALPLTTAASGPAAGPKDFDLLIPFQKRFAYDPANGNLLLDVRTIVSAGPAAGGAQDAVSLASDGVSRVTSLFGGVDDPTGGTDTLGLVVRFDLEPPKVPALGPRGLLALASALGVFGFARVRSRRR